MRRGAIEIEQAIRGSVSAGRPALAPFLTAGFPRLADYPSLLESISAEADLVEIGVPFSDPMADGVTIQRSSHAALAQGATLKWILDMLRRACPGAPRILMSYLNPLLAFGLERSAEEAARAGVSGFIVPDLPFEESLPLGRALDAAGLALIQLVTPVTPPERLARLCEASSGFVYAVTVTGTTGARPDLDGPVADYLDRVRAVSPVPVLAGFGIRTAAQLRDLAAHADGAIVGSALIEVLDRGGDPVAFLRDLRGTATETRDRDNGDSNRN